MAARLGICLTVGVMRMSPGSVNRVEMHAPRPKLLF